MQTTSVDNPGDGAGVDDFPIVITALPANARQHKIVCRGFVILVVVVAIVMLANIQIARVDALIPVVQIMMCLVGLLTAAFLFAEYSVQPQRALLALASGFVFSGLFAFLHTLAFPGAYGPGVLIGDTLNSAGWLFLCWQTTFPLAVIVYVLAKDAGEGATGSGQSTRAAIGITVACVVAVTAGLTWGATAGAAYLPRLFKNTIDQESFARDGEVFVTLLRTTAIVLLLIRRRTILDQWLIVTLLAWLPNLGVASFFTLHRFTLGWYMARVYALFAGSALLFMLLTEMLLLYTRLAHSNMMLQRERNNKLMTLQAAVASISHEIKQPLAAIALNGAAARQFLGLEPPDLEKARSALDEVVGDCDHAGQTMDNVRQLFSKAEREKEPVDANALVLAALRLLRRELADHGVETAVELTPELPLVKGHRVPLQEVFLNLAHNAIEAMATVKRDRRKLRVRTKPDGSKAIIIEVEDTGPGIEAGDLDRVFDAFVTTKPHGMGLGLAICSAIVEQHGGKLTASSDGTSGARFQISLPIESVG